MSNKYLEDIKKAQQDYINAENAHYQHVEEKKKKIAEINKFYDDVFISNKEKMWEVLEAKSKAIAKAIKNTPQWYKVEEIFIPAMDFFTYMRNMNLACNRTRVISGIRKAIVCDLCHNMSFDKKDVFLSCLIPVIAKKENIFYCFIY